LNSANLAPPEIHPNCSGEQAAKEGNRDITSFWVLIGSPLAALLFPDGTDDGGVEIEGFFKHDHQL
jgi:hypothetical protein